MTDRIHGVAIDAGSGLEASIYTLRGPRAQADDLLNFKRAVLEELGAGASTVLVDAACGPDLLDSYPEGCARMVAFEADVYHISDADRITELPKNFTVADYPGILRTPMRNHAYPDPRPADFPEALPSWIAYEQSRGRG